MRDKPYRVDPSFRGRDVQWRNMRAHYTARERDLMRQLRGEPMPEMVCIGPGPGPKNVLGSDRVVYTYSTWKRRKQDAESREHQAFLIHEVMALTGGVLS